MTERPPENIGTAVLSVIDEVVGAIKLLIEHGVGPVDDNDKPTRIHRLDNLFDQIVYLRAKVERLFREYRASLDSARGTILNNGKSFMLLPRVKLSNKYLVVLLPEFDGSHPTILLRVI